MDHRLIFLDIDGTLLPPGDMLIPESTLAALDCAKANGHKLFLCTGRNHRMTEPLLRHDCFAGAVCSAGGYVLCDGKTLVDIPMEPQQAEGVRAALERNGVECTLEARDATFGGSKMAERWKFIHKKNDAPLEYAVQNLMPAGALKIRGRHNASNALAALALCRAIHLPFAPLLQALSDYRGEPHRVELIATVKTVSYIDDSKGTNVGATVAAVNGLGEKGRKNIILIAGGLGKDQDFSPLSEVVAQYVKAVMLIGKDARQIHDALAETGASFVYSDSLEHAVGEAAKMAQDNDTVLLSPACASMDMFRNYAHRSEVFVNAVREVASACGEVMP